MIKWFWPRNAIWHQKSLSNLVRVKACLPDATKPLPKPILTYHHWVQLTSFWGQFHIGYLSDQSQKSAKKNLSRIWLLFSRDQWVNIFVVINATRNPRPAEMATLRHSPLVVLIFYLAMGTNGLLSNLRTTDGIIIISVRTCTIWFIVNPSKTSFVNNCKLHSPETVLAWYECIKVARVINCLRHRLTILCWIVLIILYHVMLWPVMPWQHKTRLCYWLSLSLISDPKIWRLVNIKTKRCRVICNKQRYVYSWSVANIELDHEINIDHVTMFFLLIMIKCSRCCDYTEPIFVITV